MLKMILQREWHLSARSHVRVAEGDAHIASYLLFFPIVILVALFLSFIVVTTCA